MKIICIDFETANRFAGSICSVGLALIEGRRIVDAKHWLVKPHAKYFCFDPFNVCIHGIDEQTVKNEPEFDVVYKQMEPLLKDAVIAAYNAAFDITALCQALDLYGISYPEIDYLCTYEIALKTWRGLKNYKLGTVCKFLKIDFNHHNAQEDAIASGKIMLAALAEKDVSSVNELANILNIDIGKIC